MLYPRPQFQREKFLLLDGYWHLKTEALEGLIKVPFSPESKLSGFPKQDTLIEHLEYEREFSIPEEFQGMRILLNFIAVDQCCEVFINNIPVTTHQGGYLPFSVEISPFLNPETVNTIKVVVEDTLDRTGFGYGKQSRNPKGIWYTPQSGIWQSVWLEAVPLSFFTSIDINPDIDNSLVEITVSSEFNVKCTIDIEGKTTETSTNTKTQIMIEDPKLWSPESPYLYHFTVSNGEDVVKSYFGMRKFSIVDKKLYLNNKPCFHTGVLDQGYYQDGLYTPPDDEAMRSDIQLMKDMGFNVLRKHIKVESPRWYYYCDTIGMMVWQDLPSGGTKYNKLLIQAPVFLDWHIKDSHYGLFARKNKESREHCFKELKEMILTLKNCPCIAMWVPFNEGWGQFDSTEAMNLILSLDTSRTIDNASGWHDQGQGQFRSYHVYFKPYKYKPDPKGRCVILSEFGGYNCQIKDHTQFKKNFGYSKQADTAELEKSITELYQNQILPAKELGLAACIYTQLSDVETEQNGLVSYDRKVVKVGIQKMKAINEALKKS